MPGQSPARPNLDQLMEAIRADDAMVARHLLDRLPELRARINDPIGPFDSPALASARSRAMIDVLLAAGADVNAKSQWWAGGFGLLHTADPELAAYAIERGAVVDVHAAARLGRLDRLRELIESDPEQVHARGGDGQTPLHFASTVEIAAYLLDHGADIDARDIDHESTPAQYMLGDRPDVARYLVRRGCTTDLLLAAAVGDVDRVREHLDADPRCIRLRVREEYFPMVNPKAGGTIYQWTLGYNASAYQAAAKFGHGEVLRLLMERSPLEARLIAACWLHDSATVGSLRAWHPDIAGSLSEADRNEIAQAARNNDTQAVLLMLEAGLPVTARGQHRGTPLHWAAWHGNLAMAQALLPFGPPLEDAENDFHATPLGWATHGSEHGWHRQTGNYPAVVEALLEAGAKLLDTASGTDPVKEVLRRHGGKDRIA
jgi:ankyrin repeat protein